MADLLPQIGGGVPARSTSHGVPRMSAHKYARVYAPSLRPDMDGLARFLRRLYPSATADRVAQDTGFSAGTVRNWLDGRNCLSLSHLLVLLSAYGPDVLLGLWPGQVPAWLDHQAIAAEEAALADMADALQARRDALRARIEDEG